MSTTTHGEDRPAAGLSHPDLGPGQAQFAAQHTSDIRLLSNHEQAAAAALLRGAVVPVRLHDGGRGTHTQPSLMTEDGR